MHLVGGQQTIQAFRDIDALDELGVVVMPVLLGDGLRLTMDKSGTTPFSSPAPAPSPTGPSSTGTPWSATATDRAHRRQAAVVR
ncbi:hypothetical protein ACFQY7_07675 [Actinomadura luteofluorescens]|uniref:hypothetical protein n=1 Tax=Actinomadura luteofluorescens TaxID=46163 RepID=UPI0036268909